MALWEEDELSVRLGPQFLTQLYSQASCDPKTLAYVSFVKPNELACWCLGFTDYLGFNASLKTLDLYCLTLGKLLFGDLRLCQVLDHLFGPPPYRKARVNRAHLGAFGITSRKFENVMALEKVMAQITEELSANYHSCWGVTNTTNTGAQMLMKKVGFVQIDTIELRDRTVLTYEYSS